MDLKKRERGASGMDAMKPARGKREAFARTARIYAASEILSVGAIVLVVWLTRDWIGVDKQKIIGASFPFSMNNLPVIWGFLHSLMGISAARIALKPDSKMRTYAIKTYIYQLAFHLLWVIWLFGFGWYGFALAWLLMLWVQVAWMIAAFRQLDSPAAWMQLPYLIWMPVSVYLNVAAMVSN